MQMFLKCLAVLSADPSVEQLIFFWSSALDKHYINSRSFCCDNVWWRHIVMGREREREIGTDPRGIWAFCLERLRKQELCI